MNFLLVIFLFGNKIVFGLIGGRNVSILEAPFQANYADKCGAVIIHTRWALTTAHCGAEGTFVRVGSSNRLTGIKIQIHRHILHPNYPGQGFDYDIQLLRLYQELRFRRHLKSVGICEEQCGGDVKVFGWGYGKEKGDFNTHLQMIQVQRVSIEECQEVPKLLNNEIKLTPRMFCARGDGQDACQGDSGGAAISPSGLVGLSSFGYGCGRGYPGIYVSVINSGIRRWIEDHIRIKA